MSRWSSYGWYKPAPKKPPPGRGIRMKKAGATPEFDEAPHRQAHDSRDAAGV